VTPSKRRALVVDIRLLSDRWHGVGDWPPSPFRAFQALVSGAYGGRWRCEPREPKDSAFRWLERLEPPFVAAPPKRDLGAVQYFVPNNDVDGFDNDPRRSDRTAKLLRAIQVEGEPRFTFIWTFEDGESEAAQIVKLSERLHTFGRGLDGAFAFAEIIAAEAVEGRLANCAGRVAEPNGLGPNGVAGIMLPCPVAGSFDSLEVRFHATASRFLSVRGKGAGVTTYFQQAPKALPQLIAYDRLPNRFLFDLHDLSSGRQFYPVTLAGIVRLSKHIRAHLVKRLSLASIETAVIDECIAGLATGSDARDRRVRIAPLPSIGHRFADGLIRRVLIEVPPNSTVRPDDVQWALAGQVLDGYHNIDEATGEVRGMQLVASAERAMLQHYGASGGSSQRWRSVTPVVLPQARARGRLGGAARAVDDDRAAVAVANALRHARVKSKIASVRVQVEPFDIRGIRADEFETDRFDRRRLRHVEIALLGGERGPMLIGDGRWLGLGLMRPMRSPLEAAEAVGEASPDDGAYDDAEIELDIDE